MIIHFQTAPRTSRMPEVMPLGPSSAPSGIVAGQPRSRHRLNRAMRSTNLAQFEVSDGAVATVIEVKDMIPDHRIDGTRTAPARIKFASRRKEKKQTAYHINPQYGTNGNQPC